jgi:chromosome segregation ATPase
VVRDTSFLAQDPPAACTTRATTHATLDGIKAEVKALRQQTRKNETTTQSLETLADQLEKLRKETRATTQNTSTSIRGIQDGLSLHAKELNDHHSELQKMRSAHATLDGAQISARQEIASLSKSLSARTQNVDMQILAPRRPR